ncbi:GLPGLI family protein [Aquimarina algiphila]|uniref:GLPGLI family protein n=1 Tax=Aquimarina algiphila TaxID=2047982 RepID=UPI0024926744|nr:GLPGLI family protein [Aquimarina algiphila]
MKKFEIIFVIYVGLIYVANINCRAQNKEVCGEVYYTQVTNLSSPYIENFVMKFNNKSSYAEEINIKSSHNKQETVKSKNGNTRNVVIGRKNLTPSFFYNTRSEFYFRQIFYDETLLVKEDKYQLQWILHKEIIKIGGFNCQKATTNFRGRTYTAWFTNQIPVPFGPWKFKGLSGLILEIYDADKVFHITTSKIKINKSNKSNIIFDKKQLENAITIPNYLNKKRQLVNAELAKLASRMPKGFKVQKWDEDCNDCGGSIEKF